MIIDRPHKVLVLGSGALQIGQAGEFDYSGSQALKALREEGVRTVLLNPNIATVQTSPALADEIYFLPVEPDFVAQVIEREKVDAILLAFGGQTALNCGLALHRSGVLAKLGVRVLGTQAAAIEATEDRALFNRKLAEIDVKVARSRHASSPADVYAAAEEIGFPVILRAGFSLGGKGAAIARTQGELAQLTLRALAGGTGVLVEECLSGWKEIEYEIVRDAADNAITVCNMENVDPMGIHTGESIVVAPTQTLDDADHQLLRNVALRTARHLGIVGECNIQYALDPRSGDYRVIEVNARLSRSSALASKATGYPLAYVAAKIALGYDLPAIRNDVTKVTTAFFEPALDYIVCKLPRWDFGKFEGSLDRLGPEMKSVGEVMAIGRTFAEALQKGLRMLEIGAPGLEPDAFAFPDVQRELAEPSSRRIFAVAKAIATGSSIDDIHARTGIDPFFLGEISDLCAIRARLCTPAALEPSLLATAKRAGFADLQIAALRGSTELEIRAVREEHRIFPVLKSIDTLAAEYPAQTGYMYFTYNGDETEQPNAHAPGAILVLGSGCYRIGSSVEFDWSCVGTLRTCRELGRRTILLNNNPETVSTDYDSSDVLVFDELSVEVICEVARRLEPAGVIVGVGGQTANNLVRGLDAAGLTILGTPASAIDTAEDRGKFSALCDRLGIEQPRWVAHSSMNDVTTAVENVGGYPVLVRPSYVLSGAAMRVAHGPVELREYLQRAADVSPDHPVVITKFEEDARELEVEAVARAGRIEHWAITEHIEDAGVHSGDATLVMPPQHLFTETVRRARRVVQALGVALQVTGPFNVQLLARGNVVKVIECNLRASRSLPFVSKALGIDFIREATLGILGAPSTTRARDPLDLDFVAVKVPQFSYRRIDGADPTLRVEMTSTGEVGCFGRTMEEALMKGLLSVGFRYPARGVLLSLGPVRAKYRFSREARALADLGLPIYATAGTADVLQAEGIACTRVSKDETTTDGPSALGLMRAGVVDLVINVAREYDAHGIPDGALIRRLAVDAEIPLVTDLMLARAIVTALRVCPREALEALPWASYR